MYQIFLKVFYCSSNIYCDVKERLDSEVATELEIAVAQGTAEFIDPDLGPEGRFEFWAFDVAIAQWDQFVLEFVSVVI